MPTMYLRFRDNWRPLGESAPPETVRLELLRREYAADGRVRPAQPSSWSPRGVQRINGSNADGKSGDGSGPGTMRSTTPSRNAFLKELKGRRTPSVHPTHGDEYGRYAACSASRALRSAGF